MDLKRIITLLLAIVMCVNLLASAFPSVAYASGGEMQVEASELSEADTSENVIMEISGEAKDTGQPQEDDEAEISEETKVTEEQNADSDSGKVAEAEAAVSKEEAEKETVADSDGEEAETETSEYDVKAEETGK